MDNPAARTDDRGGNADAVEVNAATIAIATTGGGDPRHMEMHQVHYFLAVAEELNFTRAAEACNITQPTMTRAIRLLEQELGAALVNRERNQTHLTEFGRMMLPYMKQIWQQATEAKRQAKAYGRADRVVLHLGLMCTVAPSILMTLVRDVRVNHPTIELQITDAASSDLSGKLVSGELEVAILAQPEPFAERLHHVPLYREPFVIAVAKDDPLSRQEFISVRDLDGLDYLDRINCEFGDVAMRVFEEQGVKDRTVYKSDRDDWILAMVAAGLGYAFIPEQCAVHPGVVTRRLVAPEIWREVCLVTVRGRPYSMPLGALVREAARLFRKPADDSDGLSASDSPQG
jgi:LysR family transcriptional regulator, hydrogen peroxide-inducible genes activator